MSMEKSLIIIKPDAVNRGLVGAIIKRFEEKGLKIAALKMERLKEKTLIEHYAHHRDKPFFAELVKYMTSIPSVLIVLDGHSCVEVVRKMVGATDGKKAESGTIRGDFSISMQSNVVHASESNEAAEKEINRFFIKEELLEYNRIDYDWLYSKSEKSQKC